LERERIFRRAWQYVGHEHEVSGVGDYLCATIAGEPVVICRGEDGRLRGFYNTCSHRGAMLTEAERGRCGGRFRCLYHGWTYDLEGRLIGVPHAEAYGSRFRREAYHLIPIRVGIFAGMVFAALDPLVDSLETYLGEAAPYLQKYGSGTEVIGRLRYLYQGNWKLWHENFADNYHPEFVHQLVRDMYVGYEAQGINYRLDEGHGLLIWPTIRPNFERCQAGLQQASGLEIDLSRNANWDFSPFVGQPPQQEELVLTLFPNFDFASFYGASIELRVVQPLAVDLTRVDLYVLGRKDDSSEVRRWRLERSASWLASHGKVAADDLEALHRCQKGLAAQVDRRVDISRGRMPGKVGETRDEYSIRSFYAAWRRYMETME